MNRYPYECTSYHTKMVELYATYKRERLLPFLKRADGYDLTTAMKFCEEQELEREQIYLLGMLLDVNLVMMDDIRPLYLLLHFRLLCLGKAGNHRQALQMIITQLRDVKYAIDFCKEHNYDSLWKELIDYSLDKPSQCADVFYCPLHHCLSDIETLCFTCRLYQRLVGQHWQSCGPAHTDPKNQRRHGNTRSQGLSSQHPSRLQSTGLHLTLTLLSSVFAIIC